LIAAGNFDVLSKQIDDIVSALKVYVFIVPVASLHRDHPSVVFASFLRLAPLYRFGWSIGYDVLQASYWKEPSTPLL